MNNRFLIGLKDDNSDHDIIQNTFSNDTQKSMFGYKAFKCNWMSFGGYTFLDIIVKDGNIECFEQALDSIKSIVSLYEYTDRAASEYRYVKNFAYRKTDELGSEHVRRWCNDAYQRFLREINRHTLRCLTIHDDDKNIDVFTYNKVELTNIYNRLALMFTSLSGVKRVIVLNDEKDFYKNTKDITRTRYDDDYLYDLWYD